MNYEQRIEHSKEIIRHNIDLIYHTPSNYSNLQRVLEHQGIRDTLLKVLRYILDKQIIIYRRKYIFFLDNIRLSQIRGKTTTGVSNRYINYLCAVGFINKQYQNIGEYGLVDTTRLTDINYNFLRGTGKKRPINTFYIRNYSKKELKRLDSRAKQLIDNNITPGNISFNMLAVNGCKSLADEVYYSNDKNSISTKEKHFKRLLNALEKDIQIKGYTTKQEIVKRSNLDPDEVGKLFKIFQTEIQQEYIYKPPNKEDRQKYQIPENIHKWIIVKGGNNGKNDSKCKDKESNK